MEIRKEYGKFATEKNYIMSLDTVLKIGRVLKNSDNHLKHFKYVQPCPKDKKGNYLLCLSFKVKDDFSIDFNSVSIVPENQRENLYYLRYKTSDSDSSPAKYVYGDIFYHIDKQFDKNGKLKEGEEKGNYVIFKKNAFENAKDVRESYVKHFIEISEKEKGKKEKKQLLDSVLKFIRGGETNDDSITLTQKYPIIAFWKAFNDNKETIEKILRFAPVYNKAHEIKNIENEYIKYLFDNKFKDIKKLIGNKQHEELSEEEKRLLLNYAEHEVFIHFRFEDEEQWHKHSATTSPSPRPSGSGDEEQWYKHSAFKIIVQMLNREISSTQNENMIVPIKSIYRTLCSGNDKNDIQFPNFSFDNSYKSFGFTNEQFEDLLYANSVLNTPKIWLKGTDINIFVFPANYEGDTIDADKYESFFFDKKSESSLFEFNFLNFEDDSDKSSVKFDFVFSNTGGNTTIDLIEISGIEKSQLLRIQNRITDAEHCISKNKEETLGWSNVNMSFERSFIDIMGVPSIEKGKVVFKNQVKKNGKLVPYAPYQSHMLKVLPQIYTETYYNDDVLLRKAIEKIEFSIRNGDEYGNFSLLKYDLILIFEIQNSKNNRYMEILQSESYGIGLLLGSLAQNLSLEINSFEKNYVGNLTRRISTMDNFIRLKNDIEQKLIMHDKSRYTFQTSYELAQKVKEFKSQYDKDECAFGFLESYFKPIPSKQSNSTDNEVNNNK